MYDDLHPPHREKILRYRAEMLALPVGQSWTWPESDYGKAEVRRTEDGSWALYEIPEYGGEPMYHSTYSDVDDLIKVVDAWA